MLQSYRRYRIHGVSSLALILAAFLLGQAPNLVAAPLPQSTGDPIFVGAGDIADCDEPHDSATADLLDGIAGTVFVLGDNAYDSGTTTEYTNCYDPTWGRHKARTKPVPGNHEYNSAGAGGYYRYFGAAASPLESNCTSACKGYYAYNLGAWHIVALNSELTGSAATAQLAWLQDDLAAHPAVCTLAYWHRPYYTSGPHQTDSGIPGLKPFWDTLYHYGADVVLNGHDHNYERFAPQNPVGQADPTRGIREFVVGTGGKELRAFATILPNSAVRNSDTYGVLKLTLHATSYDWQFVPVAGQTFTDTGTADCVTAGATFPAPVGYWRMTDVIEGLTRNSATGQYDARNAGSGGVGPHHDAPDNNVGWNAAETATKNSGSATFGAPNSYLQVESNAAYNFSTELTLAAWVKLTDPEPDQKIAGKLWLDLPSGSGYLLSVQAGKLLAEVYAADGQHFRAEGGTVTANTWTHVAMRWQTGGQLIAYINGAPVVTTTVGTQPIGNQCDVAKGGCSLIIGAAPWQPSTFSTNGNVDEVLLFDRVLSPAALAQLAQRTFLVTATDEQLTTCVGDSCSLRTAVAAANAAATGPLRNRIHFDLPNGAIIQPTTPLHILAPVIIDGLSQPGASCATWPPTLQVSVDGSNAGPQGQGFTIAANDVTIRGLNLRNFADSGLSFANASRGRVECNLIGTDITGITVQPNRVGIQLSASSSQNTIGGNGAGNVIAHNLDKGIWISGTVATGNWIAANAIYSNTALGIDLAPVGTTPNDLGDSDDGPNHLQNAPVLTGATVNSSTVVIRGTLNSTPNSEFMVEFFANPATASATAGVGSCQGATYLGIATLTTDGNGNSPISSTLTRTVPSGYQLSATATNLATHDTSEFSACAPVRVAAPVTPVVSLLPFHRTVNEGGVAATLTIQLSLATTVPVTVNYSTNSALFPGIEDATPALDYVTATNQSLVVPAGQTQVTLPISIVDDELIEQNESFLVTITLPADSIAVLDTSAVPQTSAVVTIIDNDGGNTGAVYLPLITR